MELNFKIPFFSKSTKAVELADNKVNIKDKLFAPKGVPGEIKFSGYNDEQRRVETRTYKDYREMKNNDGQVQMLLNAINNTIIGAELSIEEDTDYDGDPDTSSPEKEFIEKVLLSPHNKGGMKKSIHLVNRTNLRAFEEGYRVSVPVYKKNDEGKMVLDYIAPRAGIDDSDFILLADDEGDFLGFHQRTSFKNERIDVIVKNDTEIRKVFKATYGEEYGSLYGRSGLAAAWYHYDKIHRLWYLLDVATELGSIKFRKFEANGSLPEDLRNKLVNAMAKIGSESTIIYDKNSGEMIFEDVSDGTVMGVGLELINKGYSLIAKSVLAQFIDLGSESADTGSRSLGDSQITFFKQGLQSIATILIEDFWNEVITDLIKINFGSGIYPRLKVGQIDDTVANSLLTMFTDMVKSGKISEKTAKEIELKTTEKLGLDVTEEDIQESLDKQAEEKQMEAEQEMNIATIKKTAMPINNTDKNGHIHLEDDNPRPLFEDEKKVDLAKIRTTLDSAQQSLLQDMRSIFESEKNSIIEEYIRALRVGRVEVNKVKVELSDNNKQQYSQRLRAAALLMHQNGKVEAANELDIPAPSTNSSEKKIVTSIIDSTVEEQQVRLKARLQRTANSLLQTNLAETVGVNENRVREILEQDLTEFFNSIDTATASSVIADNFNRGRGYTFNTVKTQIFAFRYTAVMDGRTTEYCRALDGRVFQDIDPQFIMLTPPNHYGCRSIWTPITNKEATENNVQVDGVPDNFPVFGSKSTFKDVTTNADFALNEGLTTLKNLGITDLLEGVSIKNGVVIGSTDKYNKILEKITRTLKGETQMQALQALADILPDTDPLAATMKKFLNSTYNITAKTDGVIKSKLTDFESNLLSRAGIRINRVADMPENISGEFDGRTITVKGNTSPNVLHHEIGHAIDSNFFQDGSINLSSDSSFTTLLYRDGRTLTREADAVLRQRFAHTDIFTDQNWQKLLKEEAVTSLNNPDKLSQLNRNQLTYFTSEEELFAEAYSQYIVNPNLFGIYAPSIKDFFDILLLNK